MGFVEKVTTKYIKEYKLYRKGLPYVAILDLDGLIPFKELRTYGWRAPKEWL